MIVKLALFLTNYHDSFENFAHHITFTSHVDFCWVFWEFLGLDLQPKRISARLEFGFDGKFYSNKFMTNIDSNDERPSYEIPF